MKPVFDYISSNIPAMDGWATLEKANTLAALVFATRPKLVVELGTYAGRSAIPMMLAMQYLGHGHLIGIDPYDPEASANGENDANSIWWKKLDHNAILEKLNAKVDTLGLRNVFTLIRKKSNDVEPPKDIDIFHCDGNHAQQALIDVQRFSPNVSGYVILDDISWSSGGPTDAARWLESHGFKELYRVVKPAAQPNVPCDDWAVFQRK